MRLEDLIYRQIRLSSQAFGPGRRTEGLRKHVMKELDEVAQDPEDHTEWIDVAILGLDGAWRALRERYPFASDHVLAGRITESLEAKIRINERREWPDWREAGQDQPIEHIKPGRE